MAEGSTADCYCVCHSPVSSRSWCEHCKGDNDVGRRYRERSRLERKVIEACKAYGLAARAVEEHVKKCNETDADPAAGWQLLRDMESTQEDLMLEAIYPLIDFESKQETK